MKIKTGGLMRQEEGAFYFSYECQTGDTRRVDVDTIRLYSAAASLFPSLRVNNPPESQSPDTGGEPGKAFLERAFLDFLAAVKIFLQKMYTLKLISKQEIKQRLSVL